MAGVRPTKPQHPSFQPRPFEPLDAAGTSAYDALIGRAIAEDVGRGDVTTESTVAPELSWSACIVARAAGVVAGLPIAARTFVLVEPRVDFVALVVDGTAVAAGTVLAKLSGPARGLLTGERVALNFLSRLSGIATLTRKYVDAVGSSPARIVDTRKTTPGLRALERYAVRAGGGVNHRFDLASAVLIKDNHLAAVGSIEAAVRGARSHAPSGTLVEVECDSLEQVRQALDAGADSVLLDNMDVASIRAPVDLARGKAVVEASGGMTLERVRDVAAAGVDIISVGALTHSAPALDVALDFDTSAPGPVS